MPMPTYVADFLEFHQHTLVADDTKSAAEQAAKLVNVARGDKLLGVRRVDSPAPEPVPARAAA